jgi:hypothetical protein
VSTATVAPAQPTGGVGQATNASAPAPGSAFGVPKYGTQPRLIPDAQNETLANTPVGASQTNLPVTRFDQLDIVRGWKLPLTFTGTWTEEAAHTLHVSPLFPCNIILQMSVKLQAAYYTFNLPGFLAAGMQAYRPMWGSRGVGTVTPDTFATFGGSSPTSGDAYTVEFNIDIPASIYLDEYFDLDPQGNPARKVYDAYVTPVYMAAQARTVAPTITLAPQLTSLDMLTGPVSLTAGETSTFTAGSTAAGFLRDAWWTANNPASNPPQYAWLYTRDFFTQPTSGQGKVNVLLQNTNVSLGQVMSICFMTWDPAANSGQGAPVLAADIQSFEIVTGGSLQNVKVTPQVLQDRMRSMYGNEVAGNLTNVGIYVYDWALHEDGGYLTNATCINTYLVNGVSLNITYQTSIPSATATVYVGVEALKLATS